MKNTPSKLLNSISELHSLLNLKKPSHPLISVVKADEVDLDSLQIEEPVVFNFYVINLKQNCQGKIRYGQQYYDFDEGVMTFVAPKQRMELEDPSASTEPLKGWMLIVHPDFLHQYPIAHKIKEYGFFSYSVNEALHLSEKEEKLIETIFENLKEEIAAIIDQYTQDVVISHLDLLLNYSNRFYNRQFITRKKASNSTLERFEGLLEDYFKGGAVESLPSVQFFADALAVSPNYLNDLLKNLTGQTTQQLIHDKIIELAKELLSTTSMTVGEVAYHLGFEYPQSFNKLFKNKTNSTPLEFRLSFN